MSLTHRNPAVPNGSSEASRIGSLLGVPNLRNDLDLADRIAEGLPPSAADALAHVLGSKRILAEIVPEATLRRARKGDRPLSREMSERLYEVCRVIDAVSRVYHGDPDRTHRFLNAPHALLDGRTPLTVARSSSAGADAVIRLLQRAQAGFAV